LKEAWMMSQTESIKGDKIKALALAKECYAMKLELLTNATVVDDAIRFVASHKVLTTEKANSDERVTVDEGVTKGNDIQGSEENRSHEQQSRATTNNTIFYQSMGQTILDMEY
jgi:hypothetical protein